MKILHLTDFHYSRESSKHQLKQKEICQAMHGTLIENSEKFDFVIFSGDLVHNGTHEKWFTSAYEELLSPLVNSKLVSAENIIICQGNHDIDRTKISNPFIKYIDEDLRNNSGLDEFANELSDDFITTLSPSAHFQTFKENLKWNPTDFLGTMYSVHQRDVAGKKIGLATINTAWRSTGNDNGNLVYPPKFLFDAINQIQDCDRKIIIHHHPLSNLKYYNQNEIEDIIHKNFDIEFFGHRHKGLSSIDFTPKTGIIKILSPASLKYHSGGEIGFSILDFNYSESHFKVKTFLYDSRNSFFYNSPEEHIYEIPTSNEIREQNAFRRTLKKLIEKEEELAKELFVTIDNSGWDFSKVFVEPILKEFNPSTGESENSQYSISKIMAKRADYLILGEDKCGKTTLLKKILIDLLSQYESQKFIPFYLDFKAIPGSLTLDNLKKKIGLYYDFNKAKTKRIIESAGFILLLDNFDNLNSAQKSFLSEIKSGIPSIRILCTAQKTTEISYNTPLFGSQEPIVIKFENLRKKQIRALTNKWAKSIDNHKTDEIISKIDTIFRQFYIPFNFWTVSLFIWVFKRTGEKSVQNNVGLVNLYIESLLERENLIKSNAHFSYEKYLKLLAHLAHHLLTDYNQNLYSASEVDILTFIEKYLKKNPRNSGVDITSVWNYLKSRGIFKKVNENFYSFRLNGVFEYFLAYYMKLHKEYLNSILADDRFYLSFKNEFEIYSGLVREDEDFLKKVYKKTKSICTNLNSVYGDMPLDETLKSKLGSLPNYQRRISELSKRAKSLTFEEQDQLDEIASELDIDSQVIEGVKEKKPILIDGKDINSIESSLFILGRVFRNIDEIDSPLKVEEIFEYYIQTICHWGFKIIDTSKAIDFQAKVIEESEIDLLYQLMSKLVPFIVQTTASDHINQKNLDGVILKRVKKLKSETSEGNEFELYILLFLLVDMNLKVNRDFITEAVELISIPVLKFSILLKLHKYLIFKTNEDKDLELFLKNAIQKETLKLNKNSDLGELHQNFSNQKKKRLSNNLRN